MLEYIIGNKFNERTLCFLIIRNLSDEIKEDLIYVINILKNDYKKLIDILQDLDNRHRRINSQKSNFRHR